MSADAEPAEAPTDSMTTDPQSHKRKASEDLQNSGSATSPKRTKLEEEKEGTAIADSTPKADSLAPPKQTDASAPEPVAQPTVTRNSESSTAKSPESSCRPSLQGPESSRRPSAVGPDRGRNKVNEEEKKRGQRLFGGLLGTLSRKTDTSQQKRREETERRQKERAQALKIEEDKRRADKVIKLEHVRKIEQVKFDEQVMNTRHTNILALAQCLSTKSEPKIYYVPWKLTPGQEATLKEQKQTTEEFVAKERADFARQKVQRLKELRVAVNEADPIKNTNTQKSNEPAPTETDGEQLPKVGDEVNSSSTGAARRLSKAGHDKEHDDAGYVMVEAAEDTVIY